MPRSLSPGFRVEATRPDGTEPILELVELAVPFYPQANRVRLVNDSDDLIIAGQRYIAAAFQLRLPDDVEKQNPSGDLRLAIASREVIKLVENTNGAQGATIRLMLVRRSSPAIEFDISMEFSQITIAPGIVSGTIGFTNLNSRASLNQRYDSDTAKGLF
ncbi:MAG: DUF1833 family protein [Fluviibacter sp.]